MTNEETIRLERLRLQPSMQSFADAYAQDVRNKTDAELQAAMLLWGLVRHFNQEGHFKAPPPLYLYLARRLAANLDVLQRIVDLLTAAKRYHHKKRGSTYRLIGIGKVQSDHWYEREARQEDDGSDAFTEVDMAEVVIYRADEDNSLWARPTTEFNDGRFEEIEK